MKGSKFEAAWTKAEEGWQIRLLPLSRSGRLPPFGEVLEVTVRRRSAPPQKMSVRVVGTLTRRDGKPYASLAEPVSHMQVKGPHGR